MRILHTRIAKQLQNFLHNKASLQTAIFFMFLINGSVYAQSPDTQVHMPPQQPQYWSASLHVDHELTGQIWLAADNRFISQEELVALISEADVLLLGEKHDNPDHHTLRHGLLQSLLSDNTPALLVMEMMTQAQQAAVDALSASNPLPSPDNWPRLLEWDDAWTWAFYQPPINLALQTDTRLLAGNISAERLMEIYRASEPSEAEPELNAQQLAKLSEEIDISHCGMLPESQIPAMVRVQLARDQQMANALMSPGEFRRRILLAGNYHIRHDLSVPNYLSAARENPGRQSGTTPAFQNLRIVNLAFLEVDPTLTTPTEYLADAEEHRVYDLIWFTPAVRADDYCADLAP